MSHAVRYCEHAAAVEPPTDAGYVVARLEEAGAALLAMPQAGYSPRLQISSHEIIRDWREAYGYTEASIRAPRPTSEQISRMDEALGWIHHIPLERYVLRRIVGARCLVNPLTDKHLFPWRRVARAIGADHHAVQRWHREAIGLIVAALAVRKFNFPS